MEIVRKEIYSVENVLTFRGKVTQETMNSKMMKIEEAIKKANLKVSGSVINTIYSVENEGNTQLVDFELIIPISGVMESVDEYIFKDKFVIENAVMFRHIGNPQTINSEMESFVQYIKDNNLKPVTPFYNITVKGAMKPSELDEMIVDIYVGVE